MESTIAAANLQPTRILDYRDAGVQAVVNRLSPHAPTAIDFVRAAHAHISDTMRPIYAIADTMPVSEVLRLNQGSCSQRMGCVEALCRARGVATRVRALWLDKSFWYSRLPLLKPVLPAKTLMPWPQFQVDGRWIDFDEIYAPISQLAERASHPFTNAGESLVDAVRHQPVDLLGKTAGSSFASCNIAHFVVGDAGFFDTRDELFERLDKPRSWLGTLIFNLTYGGRRVRRTLE